MATSRRPRRRAGTVATLLANLRRAPKQIRRQSREAIDTAVGQLFDAAIRQAYGDASTDGEYRIDDLARLAGTTTRNIRVYRDRKLLPPPLRVGRVALYNDTHLTRLRLITSLLGRGYNLTHVDEMLSAFEDGKTLADVLGIETKPVGSWGAEEPETRTLLEVRRLIDDPEAFDRLVGLGLIQLDGQQATVLRPKLIAAFAEVRDYGISVGKQIDLHEQIVPLIDEISAILVRAGAHHVTGRITPGQALPADAEMADLLTLLVRLRTQAVSSVTATLTSSIESTIESMVASLLTEFVDHTTDTAVPTPSPPSAQPPIRRLSSRP